MFFIIIGYNELANKKPLETNTVNLDGAMKL